jgi:subtilisin family serine protease
VRRALAVGSLVALAWPGVASAARYAVGLERDASVRAVAAAVERRTGGQVGRDLLDLRALTLDARSAPGVRSVPGVAYVERLDGARRLAFIPNDPFAARQWYLDRIHAFDAWPEPPPLPAVPVAIIDSGVDGTHPELEGKILAARSFVGGKPLVDQQGHGTFVAGIIAAATNNEQGIAGIGFGSALLVAKVVTGDRTIPIEAEVRAIRWAADRGARVINLSLGGLRDPRNPDRDTFSDLEAAAISYAYGKGAVLVAAVGNGDQAPEQPWPFAAYPAALPHVIGVSALARDGSIPDFSDRDPIYNDIVAPGEEIFSILPRALTTARPGCSGLGFSDCGPDEFRRAAGTSFAAPQVSAAAAQLIAVRPDLSADQVTWLLTRGADDVNASSGCVRCPFERDRFSGWGLLNLAAALTQAQTDLVPPLDPLEPNDSAGNDAIRLWGPRGRTVRATIDFWDDQSDVYGVYLRPRQRVYASLRGPAGTKLILWRPGTTEVDGLSLRVRRMLLLQSRQRGVHERFSFRAPLRRGGWYYLHVKSEAEGGGGYTLSFVKTQVTAKPKPPRRR